MKNKITFNICLIISILTLFSCNIPLGNLGKVTVPKFNSDSSYTYIEKQVSFGPRVPNTLAHDSCAMFLADKLKSFNSNVIIQTTTLKRYDNIELNIKNIIAEFYPEKENRIMLFAHWDSRLYTDYETDTVLSYTPIDGANDGASGVGVLLEIARQISINEPNVGIDIIFFDAEDQGEHFNTGIYNQKSWCLGSQYWANNMHKSGYNPLYGISLDMVGSPTAQFPMEDNSRHFAGYLTKKIWKRADELGYSNYFVNSLVNPLLHDHLFISKITGIRTIMIIDYSKDNLFGYANYWHTKNDTMENIDKKTLNAVGQLMLEVIYSEI